MSLTAYHRQELITNITVITFYNKCMCPWGNGKIVRHYTGGCTSHQIKNVVVEEILLDSIRNITAYAREYEYVKLIADKSKAEISKAQKNSTRELEKAMQKVDKLDTIISKLYEDNIEGKISDKHFMKMSASYEEEQKALTACIAELKSSMDTDMEKSVNVEHFLKIVRKYTDIKELTQKSSGNL